MKKLKDKFSIEIDGKTYKVKRQMEDYYALFGNRWVKLKITTFKDLTPKIWKPELKTQGQIEISEDENELGKIIRWKDSLFLQWLPLSSIESQ